ncbi:MAG: beta-lactamase family protein [Clostridiales bacterium]|nr:beta-lactamase family protein [Clostridiales bacterium]
MNRITKSILASLLAVGMMGGSLAADSSERGDAQDTVPAAAVSDERIYGVASVSKVYVTAAVMQLVDRGLVELDEPVTTYIPDFTMADGRYTDITVRMLMDHTSGIMGTSMRNEFLYDDNYDDPFLLENLASQRLIHAPGEYAAYCNDGFDLLEIIVENVTGMDYTEYVVENIAAPVGATHTGSPLTLLENDLNAPVTFPGNVPYDYEYGMCIGAGGIMATASDVANFGSAFFTGNDVLLSQEAQEAMATRWNDEGENADIYEDANGLGWDYVESLAYEQEGVAVLGKGGDLINQHSFLLVAPDQEVSVAVLSSGGSSTYNELAAQAILDVVLEEQGITIDHEADHTYEFADEIPEEYLGYEGFYVFGSYYGPSYAYISFDGDMMHVQHFDFGTERNDDYRFLTDGSFISVDESGVPSVDYYAGRFEERDGHVYIAVESTMQETGLGTSTYYQYAAERIDPNPVSEEASASWQGICGREMVLCNERYSSAYYDNPFGCVYMMDELPGYVYLLATGYGRPLQIADETHAVAFTTMPCSLNRDLTDVELTSQTLSDGTSVTMLALTTGFNCRFVDELPVFDNSIVEVALHDDEAQWFVIGDDMAGTTITADYPEDSVIYVYNKYHEVVYSTHMQGASGIIPLPSEGYIMFAGLDGDSIVIN